MSNLKRVVKSQVWEEIVEEVQNRINQEIVKPFKETEPMRIYGEVRYRDGLRAVIEILNIIEKDICSKE